MKKTLAILMFFLVAVSHRLEAQEEFVDPPSTQLVSMKFRQLLGGVIVIKARLGDIPDSLSFILDTGSGGISLDSTTVVELGLKPSAPERIIRGVGGIRKVGFVKHMSLWLNSLCVDSLNFHVIDYEVLSSLYGERIDGIIGYSVFSRYIVKINYDNKEVSFWTKGSIKYPRGGFLFQPRFRYLPLHTSQVADEKSVRFNYLFDIGAGLTALFSQDFVDDSAFIKSKRKRYKKQGEGLGGRVDMYLTVVKELRIGPYRFKKVPVNIFDDEYNITSYPALGGLIGNDIFRRFNCILNYDKNQIYLKPNSYFRDPFDYAYSGLELYFIDGRIVAGEIPQGSPAEKAGLKAGDEVLAVDNRFGLTISDLKNELQSKTGSVRLVVRRGQLLLTLTMKVVSILNGKSVSHGSNVLLRQNRSPEAWHPIQAPRFNDIPPY